MDTKTRGSHQHRGIGRELVRQAAENAKARVKASVAILDTLKQVLEKG